MTIIPAFLLGHVQLLHVSLTHTDPASPVGLQALEAALHPCWSRLTAPYHAAPALQRGLHPLSTQQPAPQAQTEERTPRPSRCLELSASPRMLCAVIVQAMTIAMALSDTPAIYELPLHLGWAFHWHRKDSAESPAAGSPSRTQTLARRKLLLTSGSPRRVLFPP